MEEFEEAVIALECYLAAVQKEVEERTQLVTLLEQAEIFYETQRGEAKLVANVSITVEELSAPSPPWGIKRQQRPTLSEA